MPDEKEIIRVEEIEVRSLFERKATNGQLARFEFTLPPEVRIPARHSHTQSDETIYGRAARNETSAGCGDIRKLVEVAGMKPVLIGLEHPGKWPPS